MKLKDQPLIKNLAKELNLKYNVDAEKAIREFCIQRIEDIIKPFGEINDLNSLLDIVSSSLGLRFEEINNEFDIQKISQKYLAIGELVFGDIDRELDVDTDAMLISLNNTRPWEPKYVALIDCRNYKSSKAFFSKWHEIAHILTLPPQMSFKFRRTLSKKKDPEEQIVDRIAGDLAFYSPLFLPKLLARIKGKGLLTFEIIRDLRMAVCSNASFEATIRGSVIKNPNPQILVIANYGLKSNEIYISNSQQTKLFTERENYIEPKLRAVEVVGNEYAHKEGLRIFRNMEIPHESIIATIFNEKIYDTLTNFENLNWWKHSKGKLLNLKIYVEALKMRERVFALVGKVE